MKRKINRVGTGTLTVSLPSKWASSHALKPGDEVEVEEKGRQLVVSSGEEVPWLKKRIDLGKYGFFHKNFLCGVYHLGYDEVEVRFKGEEEFKAIKDLLPQFIGFELMSQSGDRCVIKDISKVSENEFDTVLRRTFLLLIDMSERCQEAIAKREFGRLQEIRRLEFTNNKLTDYCRRILNKKGYKEENKTNIAYILIHALERVADEYKRICDYFGKEEVTVRKDVLNEFQAVNRYIKAFYELFYKFDEEKLRYIVDEGKIIVRNLENAFNSENRGEVVLAHHLITITIGIYDLSYTIIELQI